MTEIRVIATRDRLYTVENGRGDQFTFRFPTRDRYDGVLDGPAIWKDGRAPGSMTDKVFTDTARRIATVQAIRDGIVNPPPLRRSLDRPMKPRQVSGDALTSS